MSETEKTVPPQPTQRGEQLNYAIAAEKLAEYASDALGICALWNG